MTAIDRLRSPWGADPLSWLATRWLALGCGAYAAVQAIILLLIPGQGGERPLVQAVALAMMAAAFLVVHRATRPDRAVLGEPVAWLAVAIALLALVVSGAGYRGSEFRVELWWAPVSASLVLIALAPYSSVAQLARFGAASLLVAGVSGASLVTTSAARWPLITTMLISVQQLLIATVGGIVFIAVVTRLIENWSERPLGVGTEPAKDERAGRAVGSAVDADLAERVDAAMSAHLTEPVAFLRDVLGRGAVDSRDQERALDLAETLRTELIAAADETWLQRLVRGHPVEVDDRDRLAERLSLPQRTALRAMLDALLAHPDSGFVSGRIELKSADSGTVAVGLRILSTLPEGRRVTFLAPYYVTLQSTVRDIRWRNGAALEVDFEAPVAEIPPPPLVERSPAPPPERPRR